MKRSIITLHAILLCAVAFAQVKDAKQIKKADRLYADWNDARAAEIYEKIIQKEKSPAQEVYYKLGRCYQNMHLYDKALYNYDRANAQGPYKDPEFYLNYGLMLQTSEQYERAKESFSKYDRLVPSDPRGKLYMNSCDVAIEDRKTDEPVTVTNVEALNTKNSDFAPVLYKDGMVFSSDRFTANRDKIYERTGGYFLEVYYVKNGGSCTDFGKAVLLCECSGFNEPAPLQALNQDYHDGPVVFSKNYDTVIVSRVRRELSGEEKTTLQIERNKLFMSRMVKGKWTDLEPFFLNSDSFSVTHPFLTADGTKLYFASDMPGGYGETDIYYVTREGNGWSKPVNLGPMVNTPGKEKFPSEDKEGNLYFSSDGYAGFGGLDICVAKKEDGQLVQGVAMKCPVNSSKDDFGMLSLSTNTTGYVSSNRNGGLGQDDIYYFDLGDIETKTYTIGYSPDSARVHVSFVDARTGQPVNKGHFFWTGTRKNKKQYDMEFTNGKLDFAVREKSKTYMRTFSEGYNAHFDTLKLGNLKGDTSINLTIALNKSKNLIVMRGGKAFFDFDKFNIRPDAAKILDSVVGYMKANPAVVADIGAHTDIRGTEKYNVRLSQNRAKSAIRYITNKGIRRDRMKYEAFGYSQLTNRCGKGVKCSEEEHQQNRRVEFRFNDKNENLSLGKQ